MAVKMAQKPQISEAMFREAIRFSLGKLGQPELELKQVQLEAIKAICVDKKDVLAVLPTGFGLETFHFVPFLQTSQLDCS